jgi:PAS domain S-box-containing protein
MELPIDRVDGESRLTTAVRSRISASDFASGVPDPNGTEPEDGETHEPVAVLLVDDNSVKRRSLAAILEPLGYAIVEAESGLEALGCVQERQFAVILLDVRMPVLNGIETAELLRRGSASKLTPIIFVTAGDDNDLMRARGFANGGSDFLISPVKPAELVAKVAMFASLFRHTRQLSERVDEVERYADGLNLLAECAPIGIFMTDAKNRFVYTNPRWSEITGISAAKARGQLRSSIIEAQYLSQATSDVPTLSTDASELCYRTEIRLPGKEPKVLLVTSRAVPDGDGGALGWVGTVADVTAQTHAEIALQEARDRANEASRMKSNFIANMSHEIRTPMNGVIGMVDLLLQSDLDETQHGFAETVRASGEALLTILNDVLDFSKVEAGKLELENVAFDPRRLVSDVADLMRGSARAKKLTLTVEIGPDVPDVIWGDPVRIRQVLTNLIGNALKFTTEGGISVRATTATGSESPPSEPGNLMLQFEIQDTGIGIEPAKREKVFAPFVQADSSTSRKYGGTGLGLAISGQLVELMGGDYGVRSEVGVGSTFWFTIEARAGSPRDIDPDMDSSRESLAVPVADPQGVAASAGTVHPSTESATAVPGTVSLLLAEDNAINQKVAVAMLAGTEYEVETVPNGAAAVEATAKRDYDAILMDCHMPEMDGYEATEAIRAREGNTRHTPIIAMTAGARSEDKRRCKASGMDGYISKPVRRSELFSQLDLYLGESKNLATVANAQDRVELAHTASEPSEPVLEREVFDELCFLHSDNRDALEALIREYITSTSTAISSLRAAVTERNVADIQRISHSVKGASAQLGGTRLAAACSVLEQQAKANDLSGSDMQMELVEADFCTLEDALSGHLPSEAPIGA